MNSYIIKKTQRPVTEENFKEAEVAKISYVPWKSYHYPYETEARVLYTDEALYVNLKTNEWPLTARQTLRDGSVCEDSCMEFFISPDPDDTTFLNFEMNPFGTICLGLGKDRYERKTLMEDDDLFEVKSVIKNGEWQLYYKVPFSFLKKYFNKIGDEMRGNFYKCGDKTPIVHYATWNPVTCQQEDFHRPEFFGKLVFEK